jgi:hypothetical protein
MVSDPLLPSGFKGVIVEHAPEAGKSNAARPLDALSGIRYGCLFG